MQKYQPTSATTTVVFPSFDEFTKHLGTVAVERPGPGRDVWYGDTDSLGDTVARMSKPWHEGRAVVERVISALDTTLKSLALELVVVPYYDEAGAYPDVARYLEGEPECMVAFDQSKDQTAGQVCRILVDIGASANYTGEWMAKRAGALGALVQVLAMVGRSVEIWIASPVRHTGKQSWHDTLVCLQSAGKPLNVDDIAFGLGHPATLRRGFFEIRGNGATGWADGNVGRTNGKALDWTLDYLKPELVIERAENEPRGTPCPAVNPEQWVRSCLVRLGLLAGE